MPRRSLDPWEQEHQEQAALCRASLPRWEQVRRGERPPGYVPLTMHQLGMAA